MIFRILILSVLIFNSFVYYGQIVVNTNVSNEELIEEIVGFGVKVSNVSLVCPENAVGLFNSGDVINEGVILTTGNANNSTGPNTNVNTSTNHGSSGDMDLDNISGGFTTFDACVLEFDIIPYCNELNFSFIFASEEYPEYVGRAFNDVFGIFVSGVNPLDPAAPYNTFNIATIGGAPINVNSVNSVSNAGFYTDNLSNNIEYDGLTTQIDKVLPVSICSTYHIKIGIADGDDGIFDAALLLKNNMLDCGVGYKSSTDLISLREGCEKELIITRAETINKDTISLEIYGTALNSIDLVTIPDSLFFEVGEDSKNIVLKGIEDNLPENLEELFIVYDNGPCGKRDTIKVLLNDEVNIDPGLDKSICNKDSVIIGGVPLPIAGATYLWRPSLRLNNPNLSNPKVEGSNNGVVPIVEKYFLEVDYDGCKYTDSMILTSLPNPVSNFTSDVSSCQNDSVFFNSTSASTFPFTNKWDFGNLNTAIGNNVHEIYTSSGNYLVSQITEDINGCKDTLEKNIVVDPNPLANFSFSNVCIGEEICYNDLSNISSGAIDVWEWQLDNLVTVNVSNPCVEFNSAGSKNIMLKVISDKGCVDSISKSSIVYQKPSVNFSNSGTCRNDLISFLNSSTSGSGFINDYQWTFGDGSSDVDRNPSHQYLVEGVYNVKLEVKNSRGCIDSITNSIQIFAEPIIDFNIETTSSCLYECVAFENMVQDIFLVTYFEWSFGNGEVSNDTNPIYCYQDTGLFDITLIAENEKGCKSNLTKNKYLTVHPNPVAYFDINKRVLKAYDAEVIIEDKSISNIISHSWDFGDGNTDDSPYLSPFTHDFEEPGNYDIRLFVTDNNGCTDEFKLGVSVENNSILYLPNVFTPDGDGINDYFFVKGYNIEGLLDFELIVFNKWGEVVFITDEFNKKWDGTYKGKLAKQDVYVYKLSYVTAQGLEEKKHGTVTLLK